MMMMMMACDFTARDLALMPITVNPNFGRYFFPGARDRFAFGERAEYSAAEDFEVAPPPTSGPSLRGNFFSAFAPCPREEGEPRKGQVLGSQLIKCSSEFKFAFLHFFLAKTSENSSGFLSDAISPEIAIVCCFDARTVAPASPSPPPGGGIGAFRRGGAGPSSRAYYLVKRGIG